MRQDPRLHQEIHHSIRGHGNANERRECKFYQQPYLLVQAQTVAWSQYKYTCPSCFRNCSYTTSIPHIRQEEEHAYLPHTLGAIL